MNRNFFIFFVICEVLMVLIFCIVIIFKNFKYHFLDTIELQGPSIIESIRKDKPFHICAWSVSKKRYIEYLATTNETDSKIVFTQTKNQRQERLTKEQYFDIRVGEFVMSNHNKPYYNKTFKYFYGRTYIQDGEQETINSEHDDSNINIDRVFIKFPRVNNEDIYMVDIEEKKLKRVLKSSFPSDPKNNQIVEWTMPRYYQYLNNGNENSVLPDENKSDMSVVIDSVHFKYDSNSKKWDLVLKDDNYDNKDDDDDDNKDDDDDDDDEYDDETGNRIEPASYLLIKTINIFSEIMDEHNHNNPSIVYKNINLFGTNVQLNYHKGLSTYPLNIALGYKAINKNFQINTSHKIEKIPQQELISISKTNTDQIFHLDDNPTKYLLNGNIIDCLVPVIVYENRIYFSNPIISEIITKLRASYSSNSVILNPENYPRIRHVKYFDINIPNTIDNVVAIIGIYGENVVGDMLLSRHLFKEYLGDNLDLDKFEILNSRKFYYASSTDFSGSTELLYISDTDIDKVIDSYIYINVFDIYDGFDINKLSKLELEN